MLKTTLGQLYINEALPPELRDYGRTLDKRGLGDLMQSIAERYPDRYDEISKRLLDVGRDVSTSTGGFSFGVDNLRPSENTRNLRNQIRDDVDQIVADKTLSRQERDRQIVETVSKHMKPMENQIFSEAKAAKNPLALQIISGARGNPGNLKSLIGASLLYEDHKGDPIPIPILRSFSEGLSPEEYWASTFGTRKSLLSTKLSVADSGYFGKRLLQAAHRLVVTQDDDDENQADESRGLPVDTDDTDNEGALLSRGVEGYPRNTTLTPKILRDLTARGVKKILVRSPMVGGPASGVYAKDVGVRERARLAQRGEYVGISAAQAAAEKLTQGTLGSKHGGGVAGANKSVSGYQHVNQLIEVPQVFRGGAAHASKDGTVTRIVPAAQGGQYVHIEGEPHYVAHGYELKVKPGDTIEAGDVLSEGIPNPGEIVKHKGIGEGRRYFANAFRQAFRDSGMNLNRRNAELISRGLINHVEMTDLHDDFVPEDVTDYTAIERSWTPRPGTMRMAAGSAKGKYLERPVLHYTIGTPIRPSVINTLNDFGVRDIDVNDEPPPFQPRMIRAMANLEHDPDWVTQHLGSGVKKNMLKAVHYGRGSDPLGTSFVSGMALNPTRFGQEGLTQGWKADASPPPAKAPSLLDDL
jgi:DNA-directed RNA polymerase subunit beta'